MANRFQKDLTGQYMILAQNVESGTNASVMSRLVRVTGGPGSSCTQLATETHVVFVSNPTRKGNDATAIVDGMSDFERPATDSEIEAGEL